MVLRERRMLGGKGDQVIGSAAAGERAGGQSREPVCPWHSARLRSPLRYAHDFVLSPCVPQQHDSSVALHPTSG